MVEYSATFKISVFLIHKDVYGLPSLTKMVANESSLSRLEKRAQRFFLKFTQNSGQKMFLNGFYPNLVNMHLFDLYFLIELLTNLCVDWYAIWSESKVLKKQKELIILSCNLPKNVLKLVNDKESNE